MTVMQLIIEQEGDKSQRTLKHMAYDLCMFNV